MVWCFKNNVIKSVKNIRLVDGNDFSISIDCKDLTKIYITVNNY